MILYGTFFTSGTYRLYTVLMIYTVANVKGGVGKTTTAVYLAAVAALHTPTVLLDADPQGSAAEWLGERPIDGVKVVPAPSIKALQNAAERASGKTVIVDSPPGHEGLVRAALQLADAVIIPTRVGGVEVGRVQTTIAKIHNGTPHGLVIVSARTWTRDFRETVAAWNEVEVKILGTVPERVAIASGPDAELHPDGIEAYGFVWMTLEELRKAA